MPAIPFTVTIDTEEAWDWAGPFPVERLCVANVQRLPEFQRLCETYGVRPTYFANHAVMQDANARRVMRGLAERASVEVGMHLHPWNTPPGIAPDVRPEQTFAHNLPEEVIHAKLETTWACFASSGLRPSSFRGGRYSSGEAVQRFLADYGFRVDASACPYTTWPDPGAPDYRRRSPAPRRREFADGRSLWEIPLTLAFTRRPQAFWRRAFQAIEHSWLGRLHAIGALERLGIVRRVWLNFECEAPEAMLDLLRRVDRLGLDLVCFTVHSSSLAVGPGPYCRTEADRQRIFDGIEKVFRFLAGAPQFRPLTMTELAHHLDEQAL